MDKTSLMNRPLTSALNGGSMKLWKKVSRPAHCGRASSLRSTTAVLGSTNTPPSRIPRRGGGDADKFLDFLVNTVKPYIDQTFRTMPEREHTTFVGNSLGGLLTLYAATKHSDTFQSYGVVAPSLQWMNYKILDTLDSTKLPSDLRFWIEVGEGREPLVAPEEESGNGQPSVGKYTQACRRLADTLKAKGITADTQLHYTEHKSEFHDEREWGARAADMLNFLVR
jgi:predicted alpha/beta superfamily hydrolase